VPLPHTVPSSLRLRLSTLFREEARAGHHKTKLRDRKTRMNETERKRKESNTNKRTRAPCLSPLLRSSVPIFLFSSFFPASKQQFPTVLTPAYIAF